MESDFEVTRVAWGLLIEWFCVPVNAEEHDVAEKILKQVGVPEMIDINLMSDRLYGGFKCEDHSRRHVCAAVGQYTYAHNNQHLNTPLDEDDRRRFWGELIEACKESGPFIGGGPFCGDVPTDAMPEVRET